MTSSRRLEQDLPALLADLYVLGNPDYRDDILRETARTRQRPSWTFLTRWIPMDVATRRLAVAPVPLRMLVILALLIVVAIVGVLVGVGSQQRVPPPFGPARNGPIAFSMDGNILIQGEGSVETRTLIGGDVDAKWPSFSPDGMRLLFVRVDGARHHLMVANADGTRERQVLDEPVVDPFIAWAPDSRTLAITTSMRGIRRLLLVHADGSPAETIDLGSLRPTDVAWRPPGGEALLVRVEGADGRQDLYLVDIRSRDRRPLGITSPGLLGTQWDVSGPAWSPTGAVLAYNAVDEFDPATPGGARGHFRFHLIQPDGSNDTALPPPSTDEIQEGWPAWSPDGRSIVVHRWTWNPGGEGWLAVMPADGSAPARDIGRRFAGGQDTGLVKTWSPDGTRVLVRVANTEQIFSIDPVSGRDEEMPWTGADLPDYQRLAP